MRWAELAQRHDGKDRWYLEALGIGADQQWDTYLDAFLRNKDTKDLLAPGSRDVIWRSRAKKTLKLLAEIIDAASGRRIQLPPAQTPPADELPRYFRAFDFQPASGEKDAALLRLIIGPGTESFLKEAVQNLIVSEAAKRLKHIDLTKQPKLVEQLEKLLRTTDRSAYIDLVTQFGLSKHYPALLDLALQDPEGQTGVNATKALLERQQQPLFRKALAGKDTKRVLAAVQVLATTADDRATTVLLPLAQDAKGDLEARRQAVRALARTKSGAMAVLKLAQTKQLAEELKPAAGAALTAVAWKDAESRAEVTRLFPLPAGKGDRPLPAIGDLAKMRGDAGKGLLVFKMAGTCANCHIVNGEGKDVGPNLSEIGKKLSREALFESILYPSAGISHNYESYVIETTSGGVEQGLLVSDTPEAVTLKAADGLLRTVKRGDIDSMRKSPISLMPADLHKALTTQELVDLVDYLQTLREARIGGSKR